METAIKVENREQAIELIRNDEMYIKITDVFSNKNENIIKSIDYSFNEIKLHINKNKWLGNVRVLKEMFNKIIKDNNLSAYVDIYINTNDCWIKVM